MAPLRSQPPTSSSLVYETENCIQNQLTTKRAQNEGDQEARQ